MKPNSRELKFNTPEKNEDGLPIRNPIQIIVVVQVWLDAVDQARLHFVHLIKNKHGAWTLCDVPFNPHL